MLFIRTKSDPSNSLALVGIEAVLKVGDSYSFVGEREAVIGLAVDQELGLQAQLLRRQAGVNVRLDARSGEEVKWDPAAKSCNEKHN